VVRAFSAMNGNPARPDVMRSFLRRHGLLDEVRPAERALLLDHGEPSQAQLTEASWRSEALVALRWAIGDRESLDVGGQVSLMQAVPDVDTDDEVRAMLATAALRPEEELRRALELWFVVWWRLRLRRHDVDRVDLRRWVTGSPYLRRLTADDLPLIDDDLSLDGPVMRCAADELDVHRDDGWTGRVPIRDCTPEMLTAGEHVLRVAEERLRALRWLFGLTPHIEGDPPGAYRPDSAAGGDKEVLYGPDAPPPAGAPDAYDAGGGLAVHRAAWRGDLPTLRALLDGGADLTAPDIDGDYAIHCAVLGGHRAAIEAVMAAEPFMVHIPDGDGRFPVHLAAGRGDVAAIEALAGAPDRFDRGLDVTDERGATALHHAIRQGHAAAADRLIAFGASLDGAMTTAVETDRPDMIRYLVGRGVEVDADEYGITPLYPARCSPATWPAPRPCSTWAPTRPSRTPAARRRCTSRPIAARRGCACGWWTGVPTWTDGYKIWRQCTSRSSAATPHAPTRSSTGAPTPTAHCSPWPSVAARPRSSGGASIAASRSATRRTR
jgi:hypothetical protein